MDVSKSLLDMPESPIMIGIP